ncbi:MAG TPA: helix-turn-helix transcriptional regulator [Bdellovibrionales bacterium]|nr:helix-turn-helix transcriptional regulator [Bdellovibrionales bacterium]
MGLNAVQIGLKIQEARLTKGITQDELAQALGVSRSTVVRWETGRAVPRQIGIPKVAGFLGKDASWLLEGSSDVTVAGQNVELLRAERRTLKEIRSEVKNLTKNLKPKAASVNVAKTRSPRELDAAIDRKTLEDVQRAWSSAKPEARLIAALLVTGDWSYKLKLWNREVSVDQEVLDLVGRVGGF